MISKTHYILSIFILLLGVIHICFIFPIEEFNTDALWFIGSGVAIMFAGLINLITLKFPEKFIRNIYMLTNFIMMLLFLVSLLSLQEIQVFVGVILFGTILYLSSRKKSNGLLGYNKRETEKNDNKK